VPIGASGHERLERLAAPSRAGEVVARELVRRQLVRARHGPCWRHSSWKAGSGVQRVPLGARSTTLRPDNNSAAIRIR
jgi:hypothetical protein